MKFREELPLISLYFSREKGTKELEVLYKDFVERDNIQKVIF